jgi:hypothetical protein
MKSIAILIAACLPVFADESNVKSPSLAPEFHLFNGKDLSGWQFSTPEAKAAWSAKDGVISCTGEPTGFIRTEASHKNYTLTFDWRWSGKKVGNSGLLIHAGEIPEGKAWPVSIEAQLESGNAGDFWSIGSKIEATGKNTGIRWQRIADPKEKPLDEWNNMIVVCVGDTISVTINGVLVNEGKNASLTAGAIGFQSEGTSIEFRNIVLYGK